VVRRPRGGEKKGGGGGFYLPRAPLLLFPMRYATL